MTEFPSAVFQITPVMGIRLLDSFLGVTYGHVLFKYGAPGFESRPTDPRCVIAHATGTGDWAIVYRLSSPDPESAMRELERIACELSLSPAKPGWLTENQGRLILALIAVAAVCNALMPGMALWCRCLSAVSASLTLAVLALTFTRTWRNRP